MAEPFTDRRLPLWPFGLFAAAGVIALISPGSVRDVWSLSPWAILVCLVIGIGGLKLPLRRVALDADGVRVMQTRGRGTLVRWEEMTGTRIAEWTRWVGQQRGGSGKYASGYTVWTLETDLVLQFVNSAGVPILFKGFIGETDLPFHALVTEANERTPQVPYLWTMEDPRGAPAFERVGDYMRVPRSGRPAVAPDAASVPSAPRDDETRLRPSKAEGRTVKYAIVWTTITVPLALYLRPWATWPDTDYWVVTFAPSVFIVPLWLFAALEEFAVPRYTLISNGDRFSITRSTLFWKKQWDGRWSDVTATRVDIGNKRPAPVFVIERSDGEPIELRDPAGEVLAWISERTPLSYGWADLTGTNQPILEARGSFARVAREVSAV